ncbi:MAG: CoA-binding protein [Deltaproteobacteria bacterium]|nr:CoA-binding protein [Deltaproteobacteria bacterium]
MTESQISINSLLAPESVAFIGASNDPTKWGCIILKNMLHGGYAGPIYPVNPKEKEVLGLKAYASVAALPETPEMAVIVIPPPAVPAAVEDCVKKGVRAGLVITAGFAEVGPEGKKLQTAMVANAKKGGMILIGPNCNGISRPSANFFPQMPSIFPGSGPLAAVAQSGNVAASLIRRGIKKGFGFSAVFSIGNEADLHCEDFLKFLGDDPETKVIVGYMEGFKDGRRFFNVAREVTVKKPIVMVKAGSTGAGAKAAMSHTASLSGEDATFDGLCKQSGIIRTDSIDDMFGIGTGFLNQPLPKGNKVGIVTMGGGWGVLAADTSANFGLDVVTLSSRTIARLDEILPSWWNRGNPVDMVAGTVGGVVPESVRILMEAPETDCVILLGVLGLMKKRPGPSDGKPDLVEKQIREALQDLSDAFDWLKSLSHQYQKPLVIASEIPFTLGDFENRMVQMLGQKQIACYNSPNMAARVMSRLVAYGRYRRHYSKMKPTEGGKNGIQGA